MHSDIVKTLETGQGRFDLCHQVFKAIRKMHKPGNRIQETAHDALQRISGVEGQEAPVDPQNANAAEHEVKQEAVVIESQAGRSARDI